ncbi:hypothetical protein ACWKWK_02320 [Pseudoxanthomonas beigongshangi]
MKSIESSAKAQAEGGDKVTGFRTSPHLYESHVRDGGESVLVMNVTFSVRYRLAEASAVAHAGPSGSPGNPSQ